MMSALTESPTPIVFPTPSLTPPWIVGTLLVSIVLPLIAGLFTTVEFNLALGRNMAFANDTLPDYWLHGFNALFAPAVYMLVTALLVRFAVAVLRRVARISRRLNPNVPFEWQRTKIDPSTIADVLLFTQVVALVLLCWMFADVLNAAFARLTETDPRVLEPLRPGNSLIRHFYRISFSVAILTMAVAWAAVIRRAGTALKRSSIAAGVALMVVVLVLLVLPYRLTWKNTFERAEFQGMRCYITATA
jgi:hypothetical protein